MSTPSSPTSTASGSSLATCAPTPTRSCGSMPEFNIDHITGGDGGFGRRPASAAPPPAVVTESPTRYACPVSLGQPVTRHDSAVASPARRTGRSSSTCRRTSSASWASGRRSSASRRRGTRGCPSRPGSRVIGGPVGVGVPPGGGEVLVAARCTPRTAARWCGRTPTGCPGWRAPGRRRGAAVRPASRRTPA